MVKCKVYEVSHINAFVILVELHKLRKVQLLENYLNVNVTIIIDIR